MSLECAECDRRCLLFFGCTFPQKSHECALVLLFDLNYKFINWSFAFSPG